MSRRHSAVFSKLLIFKEIFHYRRILSHMRFSKN